MTVYLRNFGCRIHQVWPLTSTVVIGSCGKAALRPRPLKHLQVLSTSCRAAGRLFLRAAPRPLQPQHLQEPFWDRCNTAPEKLRSYLSFFFLESFAR